MKISTTKLLFIDPSRFSNDYLNELSKIFEKIGIILIVEVGAHPAYMIDTKIAIKDNKVEELSNKRTNQAG